MKNHLKMHVNNFQRVGREIDDGKWETGSRDDKDRNFREEKV